MSEESATRAKFFAHTAPPGEPWEPLPTHLQRVAQRTAEFGAAFGAEEIGRIAGLWHDVGKYSDDFQAYLAAAGADLHSADTQGKVDHSTAGAQHARGQLGAGFGDFLAYVIAGHHAGLPDWEQARSEATLEARLRKQIPDWKHNCPQSILRASPRSTPSLSFPREPDRASYRLAFWIRMLFSALCDADFLATESFMDPERAEARAVTEHELEQLQTVLTSHMQEVQVSAPRTRVNDARRRVLEQCQAAASGPCGFFSLQVPTGGGKTLASLSFALDHAVQHDLRRVIVAVPFTTIIEQTARVYRDIFADLGAEVVLEHHSNMDPDRESVTSRLQSENWDAPLVVTTTVQLYESMFSARPSRCRKLHRIARSIIVLDEVQTIPVDLLRPTLYALRELVESYGCTVVLSSATQPAIHWREDFPIGLPDVTPIIRHAQTLYEELHRCHVEVRGETDDEELAEELAGHDQVLCIVNSRWHARALAERIGPSDSHFHLSTRMCAAHRLEVFDRVRDRLARSLRCRLVSTPLVEAGVDVDFPAVYRAECGLDSLAQAAGRCNREGCRESGDVVFFRTPSGPPRGFQRRAAQVADQLLADFDDLLAPEAIEEYFRLLFWREEDRWDGRDVLQCLPNDPRLPRYMFRVMERRYRIINDPTKELLIPWGEEGERLLEAFQVSEIPSRRILRKLQRYSVSLYEHEFRRLETRGALRAVHDRWMLVEETLYSDEFGIDVDPDTPSPRDDVLIA